jgi:hypothetical protein
VPAVAPAAGPPAWRYVLLGLAAAVLVPALPVLPVLVPIEQTLLLLAPVLAALALVGWWQGGRLLPAVVWVAASAWVLAQRVPGSEGFGWMVRGWALLLAGVFGLLLLLRPKRSLFEQALPTVGISLALAVGVLLTRTGPLGAQLGRLLRDEFVQRTNEWSAVVARFAATPEWAAYSARYPEAAALRQQIEAQYAALPDRSLVVVPAMLAIESLAVLALGWALYQRLGRVRVGPALQPLRAFRFSDQLVWGLIVGITLIVVPGFAELRDAGVNLLVFFGALYAVRGLGVLAWLFAPRRWAKVALVVVGVLAWQLLAPFALAIGVGDTWLDWRGRARPSS